MLEQDQQSSEEVWLECLCGAGNRTKGKCSLPLNYTCSSSKAEEPPPVDNQKSRGAQTPALRQPYSRGLTTGAQQLDLGAQIALP